MLEECENIIQYTQMQFQYDLGFNRCTAPLHVVIVIFQKKVVT